MVMGTHCEAVGGEVFSCAVNAVTRLAAQRPRNLSSVPGRSTFVSYPVLRLTQPAIQWVTGAVQRLEPKGNHNPRPQTVLNLD